jgi:DNA primase
VASPFVELEVGERVVKLTNPKQGPLPEGAQTNLDLAEYYISVGDGIVRTLYERPTQLRRFPDGVTGGAIYQKRVSEKCPEWLQTARVAENGYTGWPKTSGNRGIHIFCRIAERGLSQQALAAAVDVS